jgi:outer membrane protein OmpU
MNKLTKIGVSALCGSLATVSAANAGDLTVTGGVDMSWISLDDDNVGNPIGIGSNMSFSGSGELDNGWSVKLGIDHKNANAYSNTNVTVGVPGLGDFRISQGVSGSGIDRMDDKTPNVWEEAYGTGLGTGIDTVAGVSGGAGVEFTPSATPDGITARFSWSPNAGGSGSADKAGSGVQASTARSGYDLTVSASSDAIGVDGLTLYGGISSLEQDSTNSAISGDKDEKTVGIIYSVGGFTLGYQWSEEDLGRSSGATQYENDAYGITFNVNDDLSIGYNNYESAQSNSTIVTAEAESVQIAYTMGGASIRLAEASVDNAKYTTGAANSRDATTISVSLAF